MQYKKSNIIGMGFVSFFTDMASSLVVPLLPFFVVIILDHGVDKLGLVLAITTLVSYLLRFIGGVMADSMGKNKQFLILGYGLSALTKPLFGWVDSWEGVAALRSSERLGKAIRSAPKDKLLSASVSKAETLGKNLGIHKTIEKCGEVLGLLLLLAAIGYYGMSEATFRNVFLLSAIPSVLSIIVLMLFVKEAQGSRRKTALALSFTLEPQLRSVILGYVVIILFTFNEAFFLLIGNEYGLALSDILLILVLTKGTQMLLSKKMGRFVDKYSIKRQLSIGYSLGLISLLLLLVANVETYVAAFLLFSLHEITMLMAIRTYIGKNAADKGTAYGFLYFIIAIVSAISAYVIGLIWQTYGVNIAIKACCVGSLFAGLLLFASYKNHTSQ